MQIQRRLDSPGRAGHSASIVRERLLSDQTMRHFPSDALLADLTDESALLGIPSPTPVELYILSPNEQMRQAAQIAHSFRDHYLAEVRYVDDCQLTVATIKPASARHHNVPKEIWIDAAGNTTVRECAQPGARGTRRRYWFWIVGAVLTALGSWFVLGAMI